jgi:phosphotransacetylase
MAIPRFAERCDQRHRTYVTDHGVAGSPTREQLSRAIINAAQVLPNVE